MATLGELIRRLDALDDDFALVSLRKAPPSRRAIEAAERKLGAKFAPAHRALIERFGALAVFANEGVWPRPVEFEVRPRWQFAYGFEVFGVAKSSSLDVVAKARTPLQRKLGIVPVVHVAGEAEWIGAVGDGRLYRCAPNESPERVKRSLFDVLCKLIETLAKDKARIVASPPRPSAASRARELDTLVQRMASKEADERCDAVGELACLEPMPKRAITALVRALRDPSELVRVEVADALEEARVKDAVAPLLQALARARTRRSRKLWPMADETSSLVCALAACGRGEPRVVKALASQLALRGNVYATRAALEGLAEMKQRAKAAVPALEALFDDKDAWLRTEARAAVIAITGDYRPHVSAFVELLDHAKAAASAQAALARLGKRAMPSLRAARQHARPRVRNEASKLLRQIGT